MGRDRLIDSEPSAADNRLIDSEPSAADSRRIDSEPPSADEEVARLRLRLNHYSLRELEAKGVLTRAEDEHVVRKAELFDEVWDEICRGETGDR